LVDIGKLNIPAFQVAYGTTEKYLRNHPNNVYAFLKAIAEGVALSRKDSIVAKKAIAKYAKIEDGPTIDGTYEAFAPYWAMSLDVRPEAIKGQFEYLDEKEFPNAKNADPRDFYDNTLSWRCPSRAFLKTSACAKCLRSACQTAFSKIRRYARPFCDRSHSRLEEAREMLHHPLDAGEIAWSIE
jgi:ABC-type nitrate/sulfonate/bicarbonate transport system substrate-binding protein